MLKGMRSAFVPIVLIVGGLLPSSGYAADTELGRKLQTAVRYGKVDEVEQLLAGGADPNTADSSGRTVLFHSARADNPEVMKLLLDAGADVNAGGRNPDFSILTESVRDPVKVKLLLDAGAKIDERAMWQAGWLDHEETVELLLGAGGASEPALKGAAQGGHVPIMQLCISQGADVNHRSDDNSTALHVAALQGGPEAVGLLLKHKADPNAIDKRSQTPLHAAISGDGDPRVVKLLIDAGAKLDTADLEGLTPVRMAGMHGQTAAYKLLLAASGGKEPAPAKPKTSLSDIPTAALLATLGSENRDRRMAAQRELASRGSKVMPEVKAAIEAGAPVSTFFELFTALGPAAKEAIPLIEPTLGKKDQVLAGMITLQRIQPDAFASFSAQSQQKAAEALYEVIVDPESDVYGAFAGQALAAIGKPATPSILRLLRHESPGYRAGMARMLSRVPVADHQIRKELEELTGDADAEVRIQAARAMQSAAVGGEPSDSESARKALLEIVRRPPPHELTGRGASTTDKASREISQWRNAASEAARSLAQYGPGVIDELLPVLTPMNHPNRTAALKTLENLDESATPRLIELLQTEDEAIASAATRGLVSLRLQNLPPGRPSSPEEAVRWWTENPCVVTRELLQLTKGDDEQTRLRAINVLGMLGRRASATKGDLTNFAGDQQQPTTVRTAAAYAMLRIDPDAARTSAPVLSCVPLLIEQLEDGSFAEQVHAAQKLQLFGPAAKDAVPALEQCLKQPAEDVDTGPFVRHALRMSAKEAIEVIEGRRDLNGRPTP